MDKRHVCYIVEIPYHRETPEEDVIELIECLAHCMEKVELLHADLPFCKNTLNEIYDRLSDAFYMAEAIGNDMIDEEE